MTDIVERLDAEVVRFDGLPESEIHDMPGFVFDLVDVAEDSITEIRQLRADNARLREALDSARRKTVAPGTPLQALVDIRGIINEALSDAQPNDEVFQDKAPEKYPYPGDFKTPPQSERPTESDVPDVGTGGLRGIVQDVCAEMNDVVREHLAKEELWCIAESQMASRLQRALREMHSLIETVTSALSDAPQSETESNDG